MIRIKRFKYNLPIILIVLLFSTTFVSAQINSDNNSITDNQSDTSARTDTIAPLPYSFNSNQSGRLFLNDNKELEIIYDPKSGNYILMEKIGDYSENPFEGTYNDVPITSIARAIEIDLREMINDNNIPEPIKETNGFLM